MVASATGRTPLVSRASVLPRFRASTAWSPWWTLEGSSSSATPHLNTLRIRFVFLLAYVRQQPCSTIHCRTAFRARGPNAAAGVSPYSFLSGRNADRKFATSVVGVPSGLR